MIPISTHAVTAQPVAVPNTVVVTERTEVASGVVEFALQRPDGSRLPDWAPGAHIDVVLPDGPTRQYSLCGDRWDAATYRIAVQREADGRRGSVALHDEIAVGARLGFGGPRNNFRLGPASSYLFIAGGIGITPLLPMLRQASMLDVDWRLLYLGSADERLAYRAELARYGDRVSVHCSSERGHVDLGLWRPETGDVRTYACGPSRLLDAVAAWGATDGGIAPRIERFTADPHADAPRREFEVVAARSGVSVRVGREDTVVGALRGAGVDVITSCAQGVCGTCETDVIEGVPDHRDSLLTDAERADARSLFPCVSRCRGARLVLDI